MLAWAVSIRMPSKGLGPRPHPRAHRVLDAVLPTALLSSHAPRVTRPGQLGPGALRTRPV